jgi:hypothetical protein
MNKSEKLLVEFQKLTQSQTNQNENSKSASSSLHQPVNSNIFLNNNQRINSQNIFNVQNVSSFPSLTERKTSFFVFRLDQEEIYLLQ